MEVRERNSASTLDAAKKLGESTEVTLRQFLIGSILAATELGETPINNHEYSRDVIKLADVVLIELVKSK